MIPGSANPLLMAAAQDTGYNVSRSLRFNAPDSAYLSRTPGSAGNRKTFTISFWLKVVNTGSGSHVLFNAQNGTSTGLANNLWLYLDSGLLVLGDGVTDYFKSANILRDSCAWYHIVLSVDTTAASAANRAKVYVNNAEVVYSVDSRSSITQNADTTFSSTVTHYIGRGGSAPGYYLPGYLAEIHFIDGQALTPSSFTEVSATTGQLIPKAYTGTYGTNGFKLTFSDNSNTTSATLGKDTSGNNNDWSPTNFSVTAGAGNDSLVDTPTSYGTDTGAGGEVRGNYATLNPLLNSYPNLSNGNLDSGPWSDNGWNRNLSSVVVNTGKWYFEATIGNATDGSFRNGIGIQINPASTSASKYLGDSSDSYGGLAKSAGITGYTNAGAGTSLSNALSSGSVLRCAVDVDAGKIWIGDSTAYIGGGSPASGTSPTYTFTANSNVALGVSTWGSGDVTSVNYGQRAFLSTAPSGFKALCDTNLPTPVVAKPSTVFDTKLYTGNGSTQNITGLGFSPDLVWIKSRSTGTLWHEVFDVIRGANNRLFTNATNAETTNNTLSSFNSDGFTLSITDSNGYGVNLNNDSYVAWAWDAGSSNSTNTQGSITSTVRANASAGFSVITYTGNGVSNATVGHGLGAAPRLIFVKARSAAQPWIVLTTAIDGSQDYALLNTTDAFANDVVSATPTSTVFSISNGAAVNGNGTTYVAYAWAPLSGYSSMGAFSTATASTDGVFVYTNHRPRWVLIKKTSATGPWIIYDAVRNTYNAANNELRPNTSEAENGGAYLGQIDILSNGFKIRSNSSAYVGETGDFVYCSFAESPFQYARAR